MSLGTTAFKVMTEFRFDVAHAVAGSEQLQNAVGKVSDAANGLLDNFQRASMGIVASMGLGTGGVLGFLYSAIQASDKFGQSQRKLANIFLSNQQAFGDGGISFQQAMMASESIMGNIVKKADEFALDPNALLQNASLVGASLFNHGLDDTSLTTSIDLARGMLKSAPTLGIDPMLAQGQLLSAVQGTASMSDTLFQRLVNETSAMKGMSTKEFNALDAAKRVDVLKKSLLQFGSDADILAGNVNSLNGQMQRFRTMIYGQFSIFREFGNVINESIIKYLKIANDWLATKGKAFVKQMTELLRPLLENPQKLYETIRQIAGLKEDLSLAGKISGFIGMVHGLMSIIPFLKQLQVLQPLMTFMTTAFTQFRVILSSIAGLFSGGLLKTILSWAAQMASLTLGPLIGLLLLFQGFSRGKARADVINASWMADNADKIGELANTWRKALTAIMHPFEIVIEAIADVAAFIFRLDLTGNILLDAANAVGAFIGVIGNFVITVYAFINGLANVLVELALAIKEMDFSNFTMRMAEALVGGYDEYMKKYSPYYQGGANGKNGPDSLPTSGHTTHINKVEINNKFKEQMEPDRVAFTLKDQLMKASINPTQGRGKTFSGALGR